MSDTPNSTPPGPDPTNPVPPLPPPGPGPVPYASATGPQEIETNSEARTMGMLCHLLALSGYLSGIGFFVGPLVVWLLKKDQMPFVDDQGKESLNFQITILIAWLVSLATLCLGIGFFLLWIVAAVHLIFVIIASIKAYEGVRYRYPVAIRLIR